MPNDNASCPRCGRDLTDAIRVLGREALTFHLQSHAFSEMQDCINGMASVLFRAPGAKVLDYDREPTATEWTCAKETLARYLRSRS